MSSDERLTFIMLGVLLIAVALLAVAFVVNEWWTQKDETEDEKYRRHNQRPEGDL